MNLRQIEVFRALMLAGSVTGAAQLLHVSQPGISRMLAHMERQLGLALFERIKGKLHPTPEAQQLYTQVEQVYSGVRRITDCAQELKIGGGLSLRVLCSPSMGLELVPRAIAATMAQYPLVRIHVETLLLKEMTHQLAAGLADIGICSRSMDHGLLQSSPVGEWGLRCAFPRAHAFAAKHSIQPAEILEQHVIAFGPDTPQANAMLEWAQATGQPLNSRIEVGSGQTACALVASGVGVAVVDDFTANAWHDERLAFRPVHAGPRFPVFAVTHRNSSTSSVAQAFIQQVKMQFQDASAPRQRASSSLSSH